MFVLLFLRTMNVPSIRLSLVLLLKNQVKQITDRLKDITSFILVVVERKETKAQNVWL